EVVGLAQNSLDHLAPIFIHRNRNVPPFTAAQDKAALGSNSCSSLNLRNSGGLVIFHSTGTVCFATATSSAWTWRFGDKVGAEQIGDSCVVIEPELVFLGLLVDASAAPDHLIESNGGFQVTEENHGVDPLDIHSSFEQIDG